MAWNVIFNRLCRPSTFAIIILVFLSGCNRLNDAMKYASIPDNPIRFRIPSSWAEEQYEKKSVRIQPETNDSRALRVNTVVFDAPPNVTHVTPDVMASAIGKLKATAGTSPEKLSNGAILVVYTKTQPIEGKDATLRFWLLGSAVPSRQMRLTTFSYTVETAKVELPTIQEEIAVIDREVRAATFP